MVRRFVVSVRGPARSLGPLIDRTLAELAPQLRPVAPRSTSAITADMRIELCRADGTRAVATLLGWPQGCGDVPRSLRRGHLQVELRVRLGAAAKEIPLGALPPLALANFCLEALLRLPLVRLWEGEGRSGGMIDEGGRFAVAYADLPTMLDLTVELHNSHYVSGSAGPKLVRATHKVTARRKGLGLLQRHLPLLLAYAGAGFIAYHHQSGALVICRVGDARDRGWVAHDFAPSLPYGEPRRLSPGAHFLPPGGFLLAALATLGLAYGPDIPLASLSTPLVRALGSDPAFEGFHVLS